MGASIFTPVGARLACPANGHPRYAHAGAGMLTVAAEVGPRMPSRTVAAGLTCGARVPRRYVRLATAGAVSHRVAQIVRFGCSHLRLGRCQVAGHLVWLAASPCARLADGRAEGSGLGCPAWVGHGEPCHPGSGAGRRLAGVRRRSRACRCRSAEAGKRDSASGQGRMRGGGRRDHHRPGGVCSGRRRARADRRIPAGTAAAGLGGTAG